MHPYGNFKQPSILIIQKEHELRFYRGKFFCWMQAIIQHKEQSTTESETHTFRLTSDIGGEKSFEIAVFKSSSTHVDDSMI